jgi:hypothetical protein
MAFDKAKYLIKVQGGREYLPVAARLVWFREEHPDWGVVTSPIEINLEKQYAIFTATIMNAEGKIMATATKMENVRGFGDYLEKAETGAVGRALAYCGYGTQFAPELEEGTGRHADAPFGGTNRFPAGGPNGNGNRFSSGNAPARNTERPMPNPPQAARPATPAPPMNRESIPLVPSDDEAGFDPNFGDDEAPPAAPQQAGANRVAERPAAAPPAINTPRPSPAARPAAPPDEDDEDPFAALSEPAPARNVAPPPVRAAAARAAAANVQNESGENVLTTNRCSEESCPVTLTPSQLNLSVAKFGRALCPRHQKDATPTVGGGNKRPGQPAESLL